MSEAVLILPNMRGGCATVGTTVHTLFRVSGRRPRRNDDSMPAQTSPQTGSASSGPELSDATAGRP